MSLKLRIFGYNFVPKLIPTLVTVVLFPSLISLGLWQLDRAEQKRGMDNEVNAAINKPAINLNTANLNKLTEEIYRSANIIGEFDTSKQFLLDNRTHKGLPGYHVLTPFKFDNNGKLNTVIINRGWIGYDGTRDKITDIGVAATSFTITGDIKSIPKSIVLSNKSESVGIIFKTNNIEQQGIQLIQAIKLDELQQITSYKLLPILIQLNNASPEGFVREWQPYYGSIDKHNAYALQWFAMALILFFLFIKLNIKKD